MLGGSAGCGGGGGGDAHLLSAVQALEKLPLPVDHLPFPDPCRHELMCRSGGDAAVSNLHDDIHHLEVVLQLPLRLRDVSRIPDIFLTM